MSINRLPNNPALFSTSKSDMSLRSNGKSALGQRPNSKTHVTSMSYKVEPAIWPHDTAQRIPCFNRCQLIIIWMSNIREGRSKPRLHVSVNTKYRRHTDPNGGYDQNEIKRNKALTYFKQNCPIFRFAIQTFLRG